MSVPAPHFLLFSESSRYAADREGRARPQWRFVLESVDGDTKLEAHDIEPNVRGDRLDLLAVVRGLEALDQPSRVTLVTPSQYVSRGLRCGIEQWREAGWQWERFGEMTPVKNHDLWKRIDQALNFHNVEVRTWRLDVPASKDESTQPIADIAVTQDSPPPKPASSWRKKWTRARRAARRAISDTAGRLAQFRLPGRQSVIA